MKADTGVVVAERYRLLERIGYGGSAEVFAADDLLLGRGVAIKLFRPDAELCDERRVLGEIRTLAALNHPGIVTVFDAGVTQFDEHLSRAFLVMEIVAGESLKERLARGPLDESEIVLLATNLAETLTYVHGEGVVHRDIKPANILLAHSEGVTGFVAKLSDFGVALRPGLTRMTDVGLTIGSANYLAPEQLNATSLGPAVDVYSFGLVLLEAITGEQAFPGTGLDAALARLDGPPRIPARVPRPWARLITAMTALDPKARPSAPDVADAVARLGAPTAGPSPTIVLPPAESEALAPTELLRVQRKPFVRTVGRPFEPVRLLGRSSVRLAIAAALLLVVLILAMTSTRHRPVSTTPQVTYPPVSGPMASPITHLEQVIG